MDVGDVPVALADRLGPDASADLVRLFNDLAVSLDEVPAAWSEQVLSRAEERFERRLAEETSKLRVEMAQGFAAVRQEITTLGSDVRQEMTMLRSDLRQEMTTLRSDLRQEMATLGTGLRQDMANHRVELLRWSFLFWVGQVAATLALLAFMLRGMPR
jgi:hypothetical protein